MIKTFSGKVIRGSGDGSKIGFPTANILPSIDISGLKYGVYACELLIDDIPHKGVAHYGPRAVFGETEPQFEVHILDFNQDIYDKKVQVIVGLFIRETIKFDSIDELKEQILIDIESIGGR
jgi:riboflavin kinase/FMN adenylyltransferase